MSTLYVVATPLGNLEDLSPRGARVLAQTPVVAAEGVGRTRKLLAHLGLGGKTIISCREANRRAAAEKVVAELDAGRDVALVSDAGTPGLSDPGGPVVRAAAAAGHRLCPVAGPSALAAALSVAGLDKPPVAFLGFLPPKVGARRKALAEAAATGWPLVIYEGPHRLAATADDLLAVLGPRPLVVARELTKLHEEVVHTTTDGLVVLARKTEPRGEFTLVVHGGPPPEARRPDMDELLSEGLAAGDISPSALARRVAKATGQGREEVYRRLLQLQGREKP